MRVAQKSLSRLLPHTDSRVALSLADVLPVPLKTDKITILRMTTAILLEQIRVVLRIADEALRRGLASSHVAYLGTGHAPMPLETIKIARAEIVDVHALDDRPCGWTRAVLLPQVRIV